MPLAPQTCFRQLLTYYVRRSWTLCPMIPTPLEFDPGKQSAGASGPAGIDEFSPAPGTWTPDQIRHEVGYCQLTFEELLASGSDETSGTIAGVQVKTERLTYALVFAFVFPARFDDGDAEPYVEAIKTPFYGLDSVYDGPPLLHIAHYPAIHEIRTERGDVNASGSWRVGDTVRVPVMYEYLRPIAGAVTLELPP